jgi:hypothetical protein
MSERVLDSYDGVTEIFHYDEMTDSVTIETRQDTTPILDNNKRLAAEPYIPAMGKVWWRHEAEIPTIVQLQWLHEDGVDFTKLPRGEKMAYLRRKLNSNEYAYLRTSTGQL